MVFLACGNTAAGQQQIMAGGGFTQSGFGGSAVIGQDAKIMRFHGQRGKQREQREAVAVIALRRAKRAAGARQFIAGGKHADAEPGPYRKPRLPQSGCEADFSRAKPFALRQGQRALGDILPRWAGIGPKLQAGGDENRRTITAHIFLHHGGISAWRHGGAGENAHRLTSGKGARRSMAGRDAAHFGQGGLSAQGKVCVPEGPAIHGSVEKGRQRQGRHQWRGQNASARFGQGHEFFAGRGRDAFQDQRLGFFHCHQRAAKGEAIIRKLRH